MTEILRHNFELFSFTKHCLNSKNTWTCNSPKLLCADIYKNDTYWSNSSLITQHVTCLQISWNKPREYAVSNTPHQREPAVSSTNVSVSERVPQWQRRGLATGLVQKTAWRERRRLREPRMGKMLLVSTLSDRWLFAVRCPWHSPSSACNNRIKGKLVRINSAVYITKYILPTEISMTWFWQIW